MNSEDSYSSHTKPTTHPQKQKHAHHQPSSSELMSSAKFLAEAAKSTLHHETGKVDTGKAAGAAADLLEAASHYGKLEETSFGNYIEKAENYLHQYHSSHSSTTTTTDSGRHATTTTTTNTTHSSSYSDGDTTHSSSHSDGDDQSGSGYGEYFKMAQGFLKKY